MSVGQKGQRTEKAWRKRKFSLPPHPILYNIIYLFIYSNPFIFTYSTENTHDLARASFVRSRQKGNFVARPNSVPLPVAIVVVPAQFLANFAVGVVRQKVPQRQRHSPMPEWCQRRIVGR